MLFTIVKSKRRKDEPNLDAPFAAALSRAASSLNAKHTKPGLQDEGVLKLAGGLGPSGMHNHNSLMMESGDFGGEVESESLL